jgi:hypothetical protein
MTDCVFVIMQVGAMDTAERKRADEIYEFLIAPSVRESGLQPYRADLDAAPGAITPRMLSQLLQARMVIADLTARNPNVFYELGVAHSFARPLILLAESAACLPFDAKDERVIELGEYPQHGLTYTQGEKVKAALGESLKAVLAVGYTPPSPLREVAASRSVDQLAPENPLAAEMTRIRETLELIRARVTRQPSVSEHLAADIAALRQFIEQNAAYLTGCDMEALVTEETSPSQGDWVQELGDRWASGKEGAVCKDDKAAPAWPLRPRPFVKSQPSGAKHERVIELGEHPLDESTYT